MSKVWKVIGIMFGIMLLLSAVSVGVGMITGGDIQRIDELFKAANADTVQRVQDMVQSAEETLRSLIDSLCDAAKH